jgi:probable DNA repair protein
MTRAAALALLRRLASETLFQPRSGDAPVQVLGLYEANGLNFDHLWVMGLHGSAWPDAARPDPFLPLSLQREHGLPHCDPERERAWAEQMTMDLAASAPSVIFSHPGREGTEELLCSPLIEDFESVDATLLEAAAFESWGQSIRRSGTLESVPPADPLPLRLSKARGGSQLFRNQAACPFKAFAEHRLGAQPLDRLQIGLGAMRRGSVLHDIMESLWRELETQQALLALDAAEMQRLVHRIVGDVLERERQRSPVTLSGRYAELEAARMEEKVLAWLELERQRSPFRVVGFEQWQEFGIGGLHVNLKLDRIDELEDGDTVVLDYKTGQVKPSGWFGERPDDPQLPLYGVAAGARSDGGPVAAVAFAQLRPDQQCFSGVVRDAGILPGLPAARSTQLREVSEHWPAVLGEWSSVLERLALEFRAGEARVNPKDGLQTCDRVYCELAALCRVHERLSASSDDGDEDSGSGPQDVGERDT